MITFMFAENQFRIKIKKLLDCIVRESMEFISKNVLLYFEMYDRTFMVIWWRLLCFDWVSLY